MTFQPLQTTAPFQPLQTTTTYPANLWYPTAQPAYGPTSTYQTPNPLSPSNQPQPGPGKINIPRLATSLAPVATTKPIIQQFNMNSQIITENDIAQHRLNILRGIDQSKLFATGDGGENRAYWQAIATQLGIPGASSASKDQLKEEIKSQLADHNMLRTQRGLAF